MAKLARCRLCGKTAAVVHAETETCVSGCLAKGFSSAGVNAIATERARQAVVHGYDDQDDAQHVDGELVFAAIYYLEGSLAKTNAKCKRYLEKPILVRRDDPDGWSTTYERAWPWPDSPDPDPMFQDDIRCLEKAGALIAAEIDRRKKARAEAARG